MQSTPHFTEYAKVNGNHITLTHPFDI